MQAVTAQSTVITSCSHMTSSCCSAVCLAHLQSMVSLSSRRKSEQQLLTVPCAVANLDSLPLHQTRCELCLKRLFVTVLDSCTAILKLLGCFRSSIACQMLWRLPNLPVWTPARSTLVPSELYHAATACLLSNPLLGHSLLPMEFEQSAEVRPEAGTAFLCHVPFRHTPNSTATN